MHNDVLFYLGLIYGDISRVVNDQEALSCPLAKGQLVNPDPRPNAVFYIWLLQ
jgi:hypothetical protein